MQNTLIVILATVALSQAQLTGVNSLVTPALETYSYQAVTVSTDTAIPPVTTVTPSNNVITFSDGVFAQDTFSNSPVACNGNWVKSDVQIYKKGTCFNIAPVTNTQTQKPTTQALEICNFAYTVTSFQNPTSPAFVPVTSSVTVGQVYNFVNKISDGCSYTMSLDVANCNNVLIQPYYGQGCQTKVGLLQYQTTLIGGTLTGGPTYTTATPFSTWYPSASLFNTNGGVDCSLSNTANSKLIPIPTGTSTTTTGGVSITTVSTAVSTLYQCGYIQNIRPSPIGKALYPSTPTTTTSSCQDGSASCLCSKGVSSRCLYNMAQVYTGQTANVLVLSSWDNNLGKGCTGNITEAQIVATSTCFLSGHLTSTNPNNFISGNGNKLTQPFVKATVGSSGNTYNLNYYHTQINCLADSNAVETFQGQLGTCLTEDDHPAYDDQALVNGVAGGQDRFTGSASSQFAYGPNNVVAKTNRIFVQYYPSAYSCNNNDDDNYCSITSGGIAGIVIAVVFVVFLLLVILFMCIRYCGKAPPSGPAPTAAASQSKGGEGNPLLAGSV